MCIFCDSEHETVTVKFKFGEKHYVRRAERCNYLGYFVILKPPIEGVGTDTLMFRIGECEEVQMKQSTEQFQQWEEQI